LCREHLVFKILSGYQIFSSWAVLELIAGAGGVSKLFHSFVDSTFSAYGFLRYLILPEFNLVALFGIIQSKLQQKTPLILRALEYVLQL